VEGEGLMRERVDDREDGGDVGGERVLLLALTGGRMKGLEDDLLERKEVFIHKVLKIVRKCCESGVERADVPLSSTKVLLIPISLFLQQAKGIVVAVEGSFDNPDVAVGRQAILKRKLSTLQHRNVQSSPTSKNVGARALNVLYLLGMAPT
jgi:hypothetical protein